MVHYTFIVISERLKSVGINISPEWVQAIFYVFSSVMSVWLAWIVRGLIA